MDRTRRHHYRILRSSVFFNVVYEFGISNLVPKSTEKVYAGAIWLLCFFSFVCFKATSVCGKLPEKFHERPRENWPVASSMTKMPSAVFSTMYDQLDCAVSTLFSFSSASCTLADYSLTSILLFASNFKFLVLSCDKNLCRPTGPLKRHMLGKYTKIPDTNKKVGFCEFRAAYFWSTTNGIAKVIH